MVRNDRWSARIAAASRSTSRRAFAGRFEESCGTHDPTKLSTVEESESASVCNWPCGSSAAGADPAATDGWTAFATGATDVGAAEEPDGVRNGMYEPPPSTRTATRTATTAVTGLAYHGVRTGAAISSRDSGGGGWYAGAIRVGGGAERGIGANGGSGADRGSGAERGGGALRGAGTATGANADPTSRAEDPAPSRRGLPPGGAEARGRAHRRSRDPPEMGGTPPRASLSDRLGPAECDICGGNPFPKATRRDEDDEFADIRVTTANNHGGSVEVVIGGRGRGCREGDDLTAPTCSRCRCAAQDEDRFCGGCGATLPTAALTRAVDEAYDDDATVQSPRLASATGETVAQPPASGPAASAAGPAGAEKSSDEGPRPTVSARQEVREVLGEVAAEWRGM